MTDMRPLLTRILAIIFLGIASLPASGAPEGPEYNFIHYTADDGLPSNCVRDILQDQRGFIWFATDNGLCRFDGVRFRNYLPETPNGKKSPETYALSLCMHGDDMLVGMAGNIYRYDMAEDRLVPLEIKYPKETRSIEGHDIRDMVSDTFGNLWVAVENQGVYRIDKDMNATSQHEFSGLAGRVSTLYADSNNVVWGLGTSGEGGVYRYDRNSGKFRKILFRLDGETLSIPALALLQDVNGDFWLGSRSHGLLKFNPVSGEVLHQVKPDRFDGFSHIHSVEQYSPGRLLVGSDRGLALYDISSDTSTLYTKDELNQHSLSNQFVYPVKRDHEGGFWVGTFYGGANYLAPDTKHIRRFTHSLYRNSVSGNVISCIQEGDDGSIWIGSDDGGLCRYNPHTGVFDKFPLSTGHPYDNVHAVYPTAEGIWVGTFADGAGLLDIKTGKWKRIPLEGAGSTYSCYAILKDSRGEIWMVSDVSLNRYDKGKGTFVRHRTLGAWAKSILEDSRHRIWIGTQGNGLILFNPRLDTWVHFRPGEEEGNLPHNQVYDITETHDNEIYVALGNGVARYDEASRSFEKINATLPSEMANSVEKTGTNLWIATNRGLVRIDKDGNSETFTTFDGLVDNEFAAGVALLASDGRLYLGTSTGLCALDPNELKQNTHTPKIYFTGLEVVNRRIEVGDPLLPQSLDVIDRLELGHEDHTFSVYFSALSYVNPEGNVYSYKLEGFDKDWIKAGKENRATYSNLPPGNYTLRVLAANNDGVWNDEGVALKIHVSPVWYASWWMQTIYFLIIAALVVTLYRRATRRREKAYKEELERISSNKEKEVYRAKLGFFTIVAHEIRTPVSLIIGPLENLIDNARGLPQSMRRDLDMINSNARRLLSLVNQLLDFRKVDESAIPMEFRHVKVLPLIRSVAERFEPSVKRKGATLLTEYPPQNFEADISPEAFTKLVSNLLNNARKFTKDTIVLKCELQEGGETFSVTVEDNGIGIPKEKQVKIFTPFYQVIDNINESRGGTGLGLSIVKSVAEQHGGSVTVESEPGKETRFVATFPRRQEVVVPDDEPVDTDYSRNEITDAPAADYDKPAKPVMLLVDDNLDMLNYIQQSIKDKYEVVTAENGREALDALKQNDVAVIVCDWMTPVMDGLTLLKEVRSNIATSHLPFVMLTAKTDMGSKVESMKAGADAYVEKPFSMAFLEARVENLLNMRRMLREKFAGKELVPVTVLASHPEDDDFLQRMNGIIEKHISDTGLGVEMLAEKLGISRTNLYSKLKSMAGMTPNEVIQLTRLKKAAELLAIGGMKVSEISERVGFNSPSYFTKCFTRHFGVNPGNYK